MRYKSGYKYQLTQDFSWRTKIRPETKLETEYISLDVTGYLYVNKGYAWDGPSGPTRDTKSFMRGSLAHDCLYQLIRFKLLDKSLRLACDAELDSLCRIDGMPWWRRKYIMAALKVFGGSAAAPKNRKVVIEAP